jgi:hypothetical protein
VQENGAILFGYASMSKPEPDRAERTAQPYRHPQSFYFSGYPLPPTNAPMVSQNHRDFAMIWPDPKTTWNTVSKLNSKSLPPCQLFNPPPSAAANVAGARRAATWGASVCLFGGRQRQPGAFRRLSGARAGQRGRRGGDAPGRVPRYEADPGRDILGQSQSVHFHSLFWFWVWSA